MMIGTSFGVFYPTLRSPKTIAEGDDRTVQIRARRRSDLEMLREHYIPNMGETLAFKNSDYQFRAFCTPDELANALARLALDMDYTAFKHTPVDRYRDTRLLHLYEAFWSAHLRAFPSGSVYSRSWRGNSSGVQRGVSRLDGVRETLESDVYTRIEDLSPRAKQQLWDMSEADRRSRKDEEPEISLYDSNPDLADAWTNDDTDEFIVGLERDAERDAAETFGGPFEKLPGVLDHTNCSHEHTKSARRRCRKVYWRVER